VQVHRRDTAGNQSVTFLWTCPSAMAKRRLYGCGFTIFNEKVRYAGPGSHVV